MRKVKSALAIGVASLLAVGCASTSDSNSVKKAGSNGYPVLKVLSDKPYVWDDSISEALNVARMAQPAGVGNGMRDFTDGTLANTGRIGGGTRVFDAGLGLLSQGIFGVVSMEALNQGVNDQVDWKPSVVEIIDKSLVEDEGELSFLRVRDYISNKVKSAVEKEHGEVKWGRTLTLKGSKTSNTSITILDEAICNRLIDFNFKGLKNPGFIEREYKHYIDGGNGSEKFCSYSFQISVPNLVDGKYIVVAETTFGHFLDQSLIENYDGYVLVPDFYEVNNATSAATQFAFVSKNGSKLLFQN